MKSAIVFIFGILIAQSAWAVGPSSSSGFIGAFALSTGLGEMKDESGSIPKTDMLCTEATLQLGYRIGIIAPVIQLGYRFVGQSTDPDKVSGNNLGGTGYTAGAGLDFMFSSVRVVGIYDLEAKYNLAKESSGGSKVSYGKASGLHFLIGYKWRPSWEMFLTMSQLKYKEKTTGGAKADIASNALAQTLYGVGVSYLF